MPKSAGRVGVCCGLAPPLAQRGASTIVKSSEAFSDFASATILSAFVQAYAGSDGLLGSAGRLLAMSLHTML